MRAIEEQSFNTLSLIMQFLDSFSSLGYSAYVLLFTFLFVAAFVYRLLALPGRGWLAKSAFVLLVAFGFIFATNYLAAERGRLLDAIREQGGLKRATDG